MNSTDAPKVGIVMGSDSDLDIMSKAAEILDQFGVAHEVRITSAHRTPELMSEYARSAEERGLQVIIAGAGGSAHLPGMTASETVIPVIAVPIKRPHHEDEALKSSTAMPRGIPLAVMPNNAADRAALLAVRILSLSDAELKEQYRAFVANMNQESRAKDVKIQEMGWKEYLNQ